MSHSTLTLESTEAFNALGASMQWIHAKGRGCSTAIGIRSLADFTRIRTGIPGAAYA